MSTLRPRQEGVDAAEVDGEAAFDAADDRAFDGFFLLGQALEARPGFFTLGLVARQHGVAQRVLDALEIDFDNRADSRLRFVGGEFAGRDAAFGLEADVDGDEVASNAGDRGGDNAALDHARAGEALFKQGGEIIRSRVHLGDRHQGSKRVRRYRPTGSSGGLATTCGVNADFPRVSWGFRGSGRASRGDHESCPHSGSGSLGAQGDESQALPDF